jgi:hypothetical protein
VLAAALGAMVLAVNREAQPSTRELAASNGEMSGA